MIEMSPGRRSILLTVAVAALTATACSSRQATVESEPAPLTQADYYGTYDLYMGGTPEGQPPMTGVWTARDFTVYQGETPTITVGMSIRPEKGELAMWDDDASNVACASEGIYAYTDDGRTITLTRITDPCPNRGEQADGARLVRRTPGEAGSD